MNESSKHHLYKQLAKASETLALHVGYMREYEHKRDQALESLAVEAEQVEAADRKVRQLIVELGLDGRSAEEQIKLNLDAKVGSRDLAATIRRAKRTVGRLS